MTEPNNKHEKMRESFRQDALEAWEDYLATGHHASMAEVERWLASWGSDEDIPAPYPA
ncbi:transcriptional regulator [Haliea salexigens]|jgi:predicted transcriptional regulator|uniref:transcriptional regulator n=1 Tax=Haliea salexigens TaxID=287487 RepID=UPI0003FF485E|nr:transcriptional regulator [Haliea salexigens]